MKGDMKELTTYEEIKAIPKGEKLYRVAYGKSRSFKIVGHMPDCDSYLILSDGEHLEHIHESRVKEASWFSGKYDSVTIGHRIIKQMTRKINSIKSIYLEKETIANLLEEASRRGFVVELENKDGSVNESRVTYNCAESGKECKLYFMPKKLAHSHQHEGNLTDGKGGYIYFEGKWADIVSIDGEKIKNKDWKSVVQDWGGWSSAPGALTVESFAEYLDENFDMPKINNFAH